MKVEKGMRKVDINKVLASSGYDKNMHETARRILDEIKSSNKTYGEVKRTLKNISKSLIYEDSLRFSYLLSIITNLLEEEINDLPLTNR